MEVQKVWYSKAYPKVSDHNPVLHAPFYSHQERYSGLETMYQTNYSSGGLRSSTWTSSPPRLPGPRSTLASTGAHYLRSEGPPLVNQDRLYKTRPKNIFANPITGTVQKFHPQPQTIEGLDIKINKDRFPRHYSPQIYKMQQTTGYKDRISGALRMEVPSVTYVNPYVLKSSNSPVLKPAVDPAFQHSASRFYASQ